LRGLYLEYGLNAFGLVPHMIFLVVFIARGLGRRCNGRSNPTAQETFPPPRRTRRPRKDSSGDRRRGAAASHPAEPRTQYDGLGDTNVQ
jgi:hypothetical protein